MQLYSLEPLQVRDEVMSYEGQLSKSTFQSRKTSLSDMLVLNRSLRAYFVVMPDELDNEPENFKILELEIRELSLCGDKRQLLILHNVSYLSRNVNLQNSGEQSDVVISMCKDQQNSLKTIANFCDMFKRKVGYIANMIKVEMIPLDY